MEVVTFTVTIVRNRECVGYTQDEMNCTSKKQGCKINFGTNNMNILTEDRLSQEKLMMMDCVYQ